MNQSAPTLDLNTPAGKRAIPQRMLAESIEILWTQAHVATKRRRTQQFSDSRR